MSKKIGIITTGQSPRKEYTSMHRMALKKMGLDVEVIEAGALDGLTFEEVQALYCKENEIGIGCYANVTADNNDRRMGSGRLEVWLELNKFYPYVQKAIDTLEAKGCELIMLCCAERYPEDAFHSNVPFIMPYRAAFDVAHTLATTLNRRPSIGVLIPDQKHYPQDLASWHCRDWMRNIDVTIGIGIINGVGLSTLKGKKYDAVFVWGYGEGIAPGDPVDLIKTFEKELNCPIITPSALNLHIARMLLSPALDEPSCVDQENG